MSKLEFNESMLNHLVGILVVDLVVSAIVLGWVLSDPVSIGNFPSTQFCFKTHSTRCDIKGCGG